MTPFHAIEVEGLVKRYGDTTALGGVDFDVLRGTVCGLLGPNGAGKTTAVRILTTLATADAGTAFVAGIDVGSDPLAVRRLLGLAAQEATVDGLLTGRENLVMIVELHHLGRRVARARADELLEQFRAYHTQTGGASLAELRRSYDSLFYELHSLLEDADPPLARDIDRSQAAIWELLADPTKFRASDLMAGA